MLTLKTLRDLPLLADESEKTIDLSRQEMSLLVYCVVEQHESRTKEVVGELLSTRSENKRGLVDTYVSRMGKKLPPGCIVATDPLQFSGIECDALELQRLADDRGTLGEAVLSLYEGEFLRHFYGGRYAADFGAWRDRKAAQLHKIMETLWHRVIMAEIGRRDTDWNRIRELALWGLSKNPIWQEALARLMAAEVELGHPAEALTRAAPVLDELRRKRLPVQAQIRSLQQKAQQALEAPLTPVSRDELINAVNERGELGVSRVRPTGRVAAPEFMYDVFVASPMDAFSRDEDYQADQQTVSEAVRRLRAVPGLERIFYAGESIPTRKRFNDPPRALEGNVRVLRQSRSFVMIYPAPLPSSALVETGFALAWHVPGILFVRRNVTLPYLLRSVTEVFPEMLVREFDDLDDVVKAVTEVLPGHIQRHPRDPVPIP